ncbi:ABC transporter permease [Oceanidesulfovibrio marinus]|uniref:ABC transporter permease n=1 Tax=Oceanidesulfovibrio marinus TaxID=370038 RepID=A0A6P1ZJ33_9BACT|nr:FtsX-like permease family protein [Oceanidesulfovibrio marinus]TVM34582.1 ABC transporter permease [Oceanidesulfovibrio marinus]
MSPTEPHAGHPAQKGDDSISRQIVLPWAKSFEISYKNLKVRFFRSMITVLSLVLAVAFLNFILTTTDLAQGFLNTGGEEAVKQLSEAGFDVHETAMTVGTGAKERWIVILSLLVCTVGIVNAQLMSVTERFREIGIMKCLGALDSIVLRLFLLEAGMQGLAGSFAGALLGFFFSALNGLVRFGWGSVSGLNPADVLASMGMSIGAGLLLSLIGVFYPAVVAARMQPVVAMSAEH